MKTRTGKVDMFTGHQDTLNDAQVAISCSQETADQTRRGQDLWDGTLN